MATEDPPRGPMLLEEIGRFRAWAAAYPIAERSGEWECDYGNWDTLYEAVRAFMEEGPFASWSAEQRSAVLYAVARDNECGNLMYQICERGEELLLALAETSLSTGEPEAKWQFAIALAQVQQDSSRREQLLQKLARDESEYVRRRALQSLALTGSHATEEMALEAWSREDESQEYSRAMALWALHHVHSPRLEQLLDEATRDHRPVLSAYAAKIRRGDVER